MAPDETGFVQPDWFTRGFMAHASLGSFGDFAGGAVNVLYSGIRSMVSVSTVATGVPQIGEFAASKMPSRIPLGNPRTPACAVGATACFVGSLAIPGGDEGDAALAVTYPIDHTAQEQTQG